MGSSIEYPLNESPVLLDDQLLGIDDATDSEDWAVNRFTIGGIFALLSSNIADFTIDADNIAAYPGVDDTPVDGATGDPISSNWAYDHVNATNPHGITGVDIDTTPVDDETDNGISSGWAYDQVYADNIADREWLGRKTKLFKAGEEFSTGNFTAACYIKYSVDGPRVFRYKAGANFPDNDTYPPIGIILDDDLPVDAGDYVTIGIGPGIIRNDNEAFTADQDEGKRYYIATGGWWTLTAPAVTGDHVIPAGKILSVTPDIWTVNLDVMDYTVA